MKLSTRDAVTTFSAVLPDEFDTTKSAQIEIERHNDC